MYGIVARKRKDSENRIYLDLVVNSAHMVIFILEFPCYTSYKCLTMHYLSNVLSYELNSLNSEPILTQG